MNFNIAENGEIYNSDTGEVVDLDEIVRLKEQHAIDTVYKMQSDILYLGKLPKIKVVKIANAKYNCVRINTGAEYTSGIRQHTRDLILYSGISLHAMATITALLPFLNYPINNVIINDNLPMLKDLQQLVKCSISKLYKIFNELEDLQVIKWFTLEGRKNIYFNPFLYSTGRMVTLKTYLLFKSSNFNNATL